MILPSPSQIIGPASDPYLLRWILFRFRNWPRVYLHNFRRSDDERAPHNHPWWFVSILLRGSYLEHRWEDGQERIYRRTAPSIAYRPISTWHRVALEDNLPWTLVITGRHIQSWGFRCPKSFGYWLTDRPEDVIPWREFEGCGE